MQHKGCSYVFFGIFAMAGLLCGVIGAYLVWDQYQIKHNGVETIGTVVELQHSENTVAPVVRYTDASGREQLYHSDSYTNVDPYEIDDQVKLWYLPESPEDVVLEGEGWWVWFPFIFLFTHGGIGFGGLYWLEKKRRDYMWLMEHGQEIKARVKGIKGPTGKSGSYTVVCEWTDPYTQQTWEFESGALRNNPSAQLGTNAIMDVLIDPAKPKRYLVHTGDLV